MIGVSIVVVGASWGGLAALSRVIGDLPADFEVPIAVVQHRSRNADNLLASLLQDVSPLRVLDVEDKEPLAGRTVFVAPANYHLLVERGHFSLTTDPLVRFSRPSIDVTFISAADTYGSEAIGVVLTGANDDGSRGLARVQELGGVAIVQDPTTAVRAEMPRAALAAVPDATVAAPSAIGELLTELCGVQVPA